MKQLNYNKKKLKVCIIGGGYIGLPLAIAFSKKKINVTLYDINKRRIETLKNNFDYNYETKTSDLKKLDKINITFNLKDIKSGNIYIVTTPTPVKKNNVPDLSYIIKASQLVGKNLQKNDIVIYESTVYPGLTEQICLPILEKNSKLFCEKKDFAQKGFYLAYSPERINPGDKKHTLQKIAKIVSSNNPKISIFIKKLYKEIIDANVVIAKNIKTAEAAKVIENSQRDINIAFVNELSIIFNKLDIKTSEVLKIASTKWNFLNFKPGLVGGHCIGVDPYYLTHVCKKLKYKPNVILAGRKINDYIPTFIIKNFIKLLKKKKITQKKVIIFGASFKENCNDIRNSKSIKIAEDLKAKNFDIDFFDPCVKEKNINKFKNVKNIKSNYYSAAIFNVSHKQFYKIDITKLKKKLKKKSIIFDNQNIFPSSNSDFSL